MKRGEVAALKQGDIIVDDRDRAVIVLYVEESGPDTPHVLVDYKGQHFLLTWRQCRKFVASGG